jgi:superfamily II DNA helicase RecQ
MQDQVQVIVATNAFEWVSTATVKTVIHIQLPET